MSKIFPIHEQYPQRIAELRDEVEAETPGWIRKCRLRYLWGEMFDLYWYVCDVYERYALYISQGKPYRDRAALLVVHNVFGAERELARLINRYRYCLLERNPATWAKTRISPEMIQRAKDYPITRLIEFNRHKKAHCINPSHQDNHPSLSLKESENYAHCFACGWAGDSISAYMLLHPGTGFVETVKILAS